MNRFIYIILLLFLISPAYSQYLGGNDDGMSCIATGQAPINDQDFYCTAGDGDGFSFIHASYANVNEQDLYCSGGAGDGHSQLVRASQTLNTQAMYCSGGQDDGFDIKSTAGYFFNSALCYGGGTADGFFGILIPFVTLNNQAFYLAGSAGDGFSRVIYDNSTLNNQSIYATGGASDGFSGLNSDVTYVGNTAIYATGGSGDGFQGIACSGPMVYSLAWLGGIQDGSSSLHLEPYSFSPAFYCLGGIDDGAGSLHQPATYFSTGVWLGRLSTAWENPGNWSGNSVPDISTNVLILSGKPCYPMITSGNLTVNHLPGVHICKSVTIRDGGSIINKSSLHIYGDMTVSGLYQGDDNTNNQVFIYPGGNLTIQPPGQMLVGKP
jgi:hypothetical protein